MNVLDREGRRAASSSERAMQRQNESDVRRSARLTRCRERAAQAREAETAGRAEVGSVGNDNKYESPKSTVITHGLP